MKAPIQKPMKYISAVFKKLKIIFTPSNIFFIKCTVKNSGKIELIKIDILDLNKIIFFE